MVVITLIIYLVHFMLSSFFSFFEHIKVCLFHSIGMEVSVIESCGTLYVGVVIIYYNKR